MRCYPTLGQAGLEFSTRPKSGGLVAPAELASSIGGRGDEARDLKESVADLTLENRLPKNMTGLGGEDE